jgi:hypothetical protein
MALSAFLATDIFWCPAFLYPLATLQRQSGSHCSGLQAPVLPLIFLPMLKNIFKLLGVGLFALIFFWFFGEIFEVREVFYLPTLLKLTGWAILIIMGAFSYYLYRQNKSQQQLQEVNVPNEQSGPIKRDNS